MQELANVLGREHVQLEFLLFKILELQHLLRSGDNRFLRWAGEEILRASQNVALTEVTRQRRVKEMAFALGVVSVAGSAEPSLSALAERSPEPWRTIFADHSLGFRRLVAEVHAVISVTSALAEAHGHSVAVVLKQMHRPALTLPGGVRYDAPESMVLP